MNFQKKSKRTLILSTILTTILCVSTMFTTTYADTVLTDNQFINSDNFQLFHLPKKTSSELSNPVALSAAELFTIDIPVVEDDILIQSYGKYHLQQDGNLSVQLNWDGEGSVMFLYTEENFSIEDIERLLYKGILPSSIKNKTFAGYDDTSELSSNFAYETLNKSVQFNLITSPAQPINWKNPISKTSDYYLYMVVINNKEISNIHGTVTFDFMPEKVKLSRMASWTGTCKEEKTATGVCINLKQWTGDKISYSFDTQEGEEKTVLFHSYLTGNYDIVFVTDDRTIIETIPAFTGEKEINLTNLPEGEIHIILYSQFADGSLYISE